jgi:hypothetical protein
LPGTKVTIELMRDGKLRFVRPDFKFKSGDKIRLRLATNFDGYVSVLNIGSSGRVTLLYPVNGLNNRVLPTTDFAIPQGNNWIVFDNQKGTETVSVILSENPVDNLADLKGDSVYFTQERTTKDLFVQTVGTETYAVCTVESLAENVGFTLKFKHQ